MKLKRLYSFKSNNQIWRILISDTDKLLIETRNVNSKEVMFTCKEIFSGKSIFENLQLEEKFWIGIEGFYNDVIIFHKFAKPDMPGHKEIIAFDSSTQNVLWKNEKLTFQFVFNNKVYSYIQLFDSREFFSLDLFTGELIEQFGEDYQKINELKKQAENNYPYKDYLFPLKYDATANGNIKKIIETLLSNIDIVGDVEYNVYNNLLLTNFYSKTNEENLMNKFYAIELNTGKEVFSTILNSNSNAFVPDSFFVYKSLLLMLKEKNELLIYNLSEDN
ncbi:DUF4905 domain-containing protein [Melioribacteraceae bacterium 4301-Me]|uniref:DUF4905 domain-containing protein n=1 Tax=Pyranulibacter aquaticus TaxID=3163344 RepID=UPI003599A98E